MRVQKEKLLPNFIAFFPVQAKEFIAILQIQQTNQRYALISIGGNKEAHLSIAIECYLCAFDFIQLIINA